MFRAPKIDDIEKGDDEESEPQFRSNKLQERKKVGEVGRNRVGRNGDRDNIIEKKGPSGNKRNKVVERFPGKGCAPSTIGHTRREFGIGRGCTRKNKPRKDQRDRRGSQRVERRDSQGVVDCRTEVAVADGKQIHYTEDTFHVSFINLEDFLFHFTSAASRNP